MRVMGAGILVMRRVGLKGTYYQANTTSNETVCCLMAECGDKCGMWCCPFASSESFLNVCHLRLEAFMMGFDGLACGFCGFIPYLLRLSSSVEDVLIGTK